MAKLILITLIIMPFPVVLAEQHLMDFILVGLKSDPKIQSSQMLQEASKLDLEAEQSAYYPSIKLSSIAAHNYDFESEVNVNAFDLSLTLTQPLFDLSIKAKVDTAKTQNDLDNASFMLANKYLSMMVFTNLCLASINEALSRSF